MFVLMWDKLWNYQDSDNYHSTSISDSGVISDHTVADVIRQANALVTSNNSDIHLHNLKCQTNHDRPSEYYSYEFDGVIREVVSETPFNADEIHVSDSYKERVRVLREEIIKAEKIHADLQLAAKRQQLALLKKELGEE